jgi:hypothetical protein
MSIGAGKFCPKLCEGLNGYCFLESVPRPLCNLTPYDHLRRFAPSTSRGKIHEIRGHVSPDVAAAMYSLVSCESHDIEAAFDVIKAGGPKARGLSFPPIILSSFPDLKPDVSLAER